MTSQSHFVQPPRVAVWLISLFAFAETGEAIMGDLHEEFSLLVPQAGTSSARSWYWRQTIKTIPRLAGLGFRSAPWVSIAAVAGGYLLRKSVGPLVGRVTFAVLKRCRIVFEGHHGAYLFFATTGQDIAHLITFLLIGIIVALAARERETVVTAALALIFGVIAVAGSTYGAIRTGDYALLWRLTWYFADSLAVVVAGAIVRTCRFAAESRPSAT